MNSTVRLSPSGISSYYSCPRKFYYRQVEKLPEKPTVFQIRGRILHKCFELFFNAVDISKISEEKHWHDIWKDFRSVLFALLEEEWAKIGKPDSGYEDIFESKAQSSELLSETREFVDFFAAKMSYSFYNKLHELEKDDFFDLNLKKHFYPKGREYRIELEEENIIGFIDKTLNLYGKGVAIVDYKTSKSRLPHFISESDLKQCKVYAWLWFRKFQELPKFISIFYVRDGESVYYPISEADLKEVDESIAEIRSKGRVKENFAKKASPLCNYCDFFPHCFESKEAFELSLQAQKA